MVHTAVSYGYGPGIKNLFWTFCRCPHKDHHITRAKHEVEWLSFCSSYNAVIVFVSVDTAIATCTRVQGSLSPLTLIHPALLVSAWIYTGAILTVLNCQSVVCISLEKEQKRAEELSLQLNKVKLQAEGQYKQMRVEHRARQRAQARKGVLLEQIKLLKSADRQRSQDQENSSSKAIDSLLKVEKEKSKLQSELSKCLERSQAKFRNSKQQLHALQTKLTES